MRDWNLFASNDVVVDMKSDDHMARSWRSSSVVTCAASTCMPATAKD